MEDKAFWIWEFESGKSIMLLIFKPKSSAESPERDIIRQACIGLEGGVSSLP